jgi:hypothetical protein
MLKTHRVECGSSRCRLVPLELWRDVRRESKHVALTSSGKGC